MPADLMPAAVYVGDGALEVQTLPVPTVGDDEVLVEVSHCGICGSDLHLVLEQYARPGSVLGHEWAGRIAAVGDAVDGWALGTPVVADDRAGCGTCRACRRGRPSVCLRRPPPNFLGSNGAYCRYVRVAAPRLLRVPDGLAVRTAALTEPTAIALHAAHLAGASPGDRVLVTGAGPVGLLMVAVLRSLGVEDVSEPAPGRRRRAEEVGAARVVTPEDLAPVPIGRTADPAYTLAFECSGRARAAEAALDQLDYAGTLVFVGTGSEWPRVNHNRMIVLELSAIGAYNYDAEGFGPALELLASGRLPVEALIEPTDIGLDAILPTMRRLAAGEVAAKVLVRPEAHL
jgi:(R,R)-butanediol dehydrogenase / meso-butanediol dehydrogenase / diacetyl reductase